MANAGITADLAKKNNVRWNESINVVRDVYVPIEEQTYNRWDIR